MTATPWADDKLNRRADGEHLIKVMMERYAARVAAGNGSYILNIDASWGSGKTFFLDNLAISLRNDAHVVAMVNAWQDDHANDPLITVMAAIEDALKPFLDKEPKAKAAFKKGKAALGTVAAETGKQMAFHALKTVAGISVDKIADRVREAAGAAAETSAATKGSQKETDESFDKSFEKVWDASLKTLVGERITQHQKANAAIRMFKEQTAAAIAHAVGKGMRAPMFVFIDELDRCRPTYAIKLLEDVKHLFSIEGIVFVVATDSEQLAHSVKAIYGSDFQGRKYLRRFFDRVFVFPESNRQIFVEHLLEKFGINTSKHFYAFAKIDPEVIITGWADQLGFSNRDLIQCFEIISSFVTSWEHESQIEPIFLLSLIWAFYTDDKTSFTAIANGKNIKLTELAKWKINHLKFDMLIDKHVPVYTEISDLINAVPRLRLEAFTSPNPDPSFYERYISHEKASRFSSGMTDTSCKSLLSEYPSRVRNAGRVIDR